MERCKTCKHWTPYTTKHPDRVAREDERAGGFCDSEKLTEECGQGHGADMLVYPYPEGGSFWTGPEFGCVNHEYSPAHDAQRGPGHHCPDDHDGDRGVDGEHQAPST